MVSQGRHPPHAVNGRTSLRRAVFLLASLLCGGPGGCAGWWDEVTSRQFHFKDMFKAKPDPMWVILNSTDGDERDKALRRLEEPLQHGGTQEQQDTVVKVLAWTVESDPQPVCRLAAIQALRHFKDPRAVQALIWAYYRSTSSPSISPESAAAIQCQALQALGDTGNPAALPVLVRVLRGPPATGAERDKFKDMDQRIAAARALGNFPQYQSTEALVGVLRSERDVALRSRATESLQLVTGQDLPADAQAWDDFLHRPDGQPQSPAAPGFMKKVLELVSFK